MNSVKKVKIRRLATGVPGLDNLLGGGLPEFSFNLIAGSPGCGKTTLANQIMFALASPENRALFFTVLGEPALKMLRYQQQYSFFDATKINESIRFVNLSAELLEGNFDSVMVRIADHVKDYTPSFVFVDSFRSVVQSAKAGTDSVAALQRFVQQLGIRMTSWQATTFLIGEYETPETQSAPVFTVADGIIWLSQKLHRDFMVRKIQVVKMRGQSQVPGLHAFRICDAGIQVFPRAMVQPGSMLDTVIKNNAPIVNKRIRMGVPGLDKMLGGGLPAGYSLLVVGPSGSGKTILATDFLAEGVRQGEPGVIAAFEKTPSQLLSTKLHALVTAKQVGVIDTRSLDLSIDQTLHDLLEMVNRMKAKRVVIDSLSGFELAVAPEFREDFRGSLYRMIAELTGMGISILMIAELEDRYTDLRFSPYGSAFLADAIILQRYVELEGQFKRAISVVKVRGSDHSKALRLFSIVDGSFVIGEPILGYSGVLSGAPTPSPTGADQLVHTPVS